MNAQQIVDRFVDFSSTRFSSTGRDKMLCELKMSLIAVQSIDIVSGDKFEAEQRRAKDAAINKLNNDIKNHQDFILANY